jgi:hypothetical protein
MKLLSRFAATLSARQFLFFFSVQSGKKIAKRRMNTGGSGEIRTTLTIRFATLL